MIKVNLIYNQIQILSNSFSGEIILKQHSDRIKDYTYLVTDSLGRTLLHGQANGKETKLNLTDLPFGIYLINVMLNGNPIKTKKVAYGKG